jgi:ketosteroid isomerase-like protein
MKTLKTSAIVLFLLIGQITFAQNKSYKETVIENPTAEEDLKVVADYYDALLNNKMDKVASLLAENFVHKGPSFGKTETKVELIANWKESHKVRKEQKNNFISQTFRVIDGDYKGDWVSVWGNYIFTQDSIEVNMPYQSTAMVTDGKIASLTTYYDALAIYQTMGYKLTKN